MEKDQTVNIPGGLVYGEIKIKKGQKTSLTGTSIFDPVLCELSYRWLCPQNGLILDPFAGGSVRGIVASKLGRQYVGVDLRKEQVEANMRQAEEICEKDMPVWHVGNSANIDKIAPGEYDFIFSCPPYADLEKYSDNPDDLSNMKYEDFLAVYRDIIAKSCAMLKDNSFAAFVVGEVRGKDGNYYGFVPDTIQAFRDAGLSYYNEIIVVTCAATLSLRAGRQFEASRKIGKTHQNLLVFLKGDAFKATKRIGSVDMSGAEEEAERIFGARSPAGGFA